MGQCDAGVRIRAYLTLASCVLLTVWACGDKPASGPKGIESRGPSSSASAEGSHGRTGSEVEVGAGAELPAADGGGSAAGFGASASLVPSTGGAEAEAPSKSPTEVAQEEEPAPRLTVLPPGSLGPCAFEPEPTGLRVENSNCSDGIYRGDVRIHTPADVENLRGCVRVVGHVRVEPGQLTDLHGLEALRAIDGTLTIYGSDCLSKGACSTPLFESARGLDGLRCVSGDVVLNTRRHSGVWDDLRGFSGLIEIGGALTLDMDEVSDPAGFASLRRVWGHIARVDPAAFDGYTFPELETVFGELQVGRAPQLSYHCGAGPACYSGVIGCDLHVTNGSELEALRGCAYALRDLVISGAEINDLSALSELREVRGALTITRPDPRAGSELMHLDALSKLRRVSRLELSHLPKLSNLAGVKQLAVTSSLLLVDLAMLVEVDAFAGSSATTLVVTDNPQLRHIGGLSLASHAADIQVLRNPKLQGVGFLSEITQVTYSLTLGDLPGLTSLSGLEQLTAVGELVIENCDALTDLTGLGTAHGLEGRLRIAGNARLANFSGAKLRYTSHADIADNPALTTLIGLPMNAGAPPAVRLARLPGLANLNDLAPATSLELTIEACDKLQDLTGLTGLRRGALRLTNNAALVNLQGLTGLTQLRELSLVRNPKLVSLDGLPSLSELGGLHLEHNPALSDLGALRRVVRMAPRADVRVIDNDALSTLDDLPPLTELCTLIIQGNARLKQLSGLETLTTLSGKEIRVDNPVFWRSPTTMWVQPTIRILDNPALTSLRKLSAITSTGIVLEVRGNSRLPQCEVAWFAKHVGAAEQKGPNGPPGHCAREP